MYVTWHPDAIAGVKSAVDFGQVYWPTQAAELAAFVISAVEQLRAFPLSGRLGKIEGSRELVLSKYPLLVVYVPSADNILILHVLHQRQKWPSAYGN